MTVFRAIERGVCGSFFILYGCTPQGAWKEGAQVNDSSSAAYDIQGVLQGDTGVHDVDGDGFVQEEDCDDGNPLINPDAAELCNGVDDDCDGETDNSSDGTWYLDQDGDGYGAVAAEECNESGGWVSRGGDCDDSNSSIHPTSTVLIDGVDSDCNGQNDWLATIYVAVDDDGELCVNGEVVGETGNWMDGRRYEVWLKSGAATIGIHGWDVGHHVTAAIAHIELSDGSMWVSDETWRYDPDPQVLGGKQGWCHNGFDDSSWELVLDLGPIGNAANPWGNAPSSFPPNSPIH